MSKYNVGDLVVIDKPKSTLSFRYVNQIAKVMKPNKWMKLEVWDAELGRSVIVCVWKKEVSPIFTR